MDVSLISVPIAVQGAYSEGGIPLNVHAIANIKVSTDRRFVGNAIERFLGKDRTEIARVVKETLEGHLRGVLATLTPEELNEDRLKFSRQLEASAGPDLEKLGLELDVLKIQHVADDRNYLESIGRQRIAEILRDAEVAESDAARAAEQSEAAARARGEVAMTNAQGRGPAQGRTSCARSRPRSTPRPAARRSAPRPPASRPAPRPSSRSRRSAASSSSSACPAEVTIPAEVDAQVRELFAAGQAASIAADGEAHGRGARRGRRGVERQRRPRDGHVRAPAPRPDLRRRRAAPRAGSRSSEVNLIDGGDGKTIPAYAAAYPATIAALLEQVSRRSASTSRGSSPAGRPRRRLPPPPPARAARSRHAEPGHSSALVGSSPR